MYRKDLLHYRIMLHEHTTLSLFLISQTELRQTLIEYSVKFR